MGIIKRSFRRRTFLKQLGFGAGVLALQSFLRRFSSPLQAQSPPVKVFLVKNGDYLQNITKLWELLGGPQRYIQPSDVVVIKGNAQWPNQGYTHTGCIKAVIDQILAIPGFSGEILICDNVQNYGSSGQFGFDALPNLRNRNWPDHNWNSLAEQYQAEGKSVSSKRWYNSETDISGPADGEGWIRSFFTLHGAQCYLSYPIFRSPLNPNRMIDPKHGVWENGRYTGRRVRTIFMPNLNNHGSGSEDYAGITSAVKSFFGATEIHYGAASTFRGHRNIHAASYSRQNATWAGELAARFIQTMYSPVLYITAAIWSGHHSRTGAAVETKAVLACENPATLDYVACRDIIGPHAAYLNPDNNNNTRRQIVGCVDAGIGTITPGEYEIVSYDFDSPPPTPTPDVDRVPDAPRNLRLHRV